MRFDFFHWREPVPEKIAPQELGNLGERLAIAFLQRQHYRIVATNYVAPLGRGRTGRQLTGEVDIIAYAPQNSLRFIEVKTRSSAMFAAPQSAVDLRKQRQILRASWVYRRVLQLGDEPFGFDVIAIIANKNKAAQLELLPNYFSPETFSRSVWSKRY